MSETPDLNALANRYLDLWQDQMRRMANDPATADMVARAFSLMTKSVQAFAAADAASRQQTPQQGTPPSDAIATNARSSDHTSGAAPQQAEDRRQAAAHADGTAPATAVPGDGGLDLSRLRQRIAALEERVAVLEERHAAAP